VPGAAAATAAAGARPAAATAAGARPATATAQGPATEAPESESAAVGDERANGPVPATEERAAPAAPDQTPAGGPAAPGERSDEEPSAPGGAPDADSGAGEAPREAPDAGPSMPVAAPAGAGAAAAAAASSNSQAATGVPGAGSRPAAPPVPGSRPPARPGGPGRAVPQQTAIIAPPSAAPWYRRLTANPLYLVLAIAGVLIVGGAAAFGVSQLVGEDEGGGAAQGPQQVAEEPNGGGGEEGQRRRNRGGAAVNPANVTVAVLNGTTVPGLAATIMDRVEGAGFRAGTVANFLPNQQLGESVVQYTPGHERDAAAVSRRLGIAQREAINPSSQELAGDATVVVLVGADEAP
jgi:LytR cell envelope-related transcriptional attenuator